MDARLFSSDYLAARNRFRAAALSLGCALEAHPIGAKSAEGDALCIDVAIHAGASAQRTLVISSGLHGVEGFFGSALQLGILAQWARYPDRRPPLRCVFLHALNPYGFAWRRRVDERNVDLNRNFLLADEAYRGSPDGYSLLDPLLNPRRGPSRWEPVRMKFVAAAARCGIAALKKTIASGQYDFPEGLFYGGNAPSRTHRILDENVERWLANAEFVVHLDLHTGLGPWANYKLLVDHALSKTQAQWLNERFEADAIETPDTQRIAYTTRGNFLRWALAHSGGRQYLGLNAEFGTHHSLRVLAALRAENQCHHWLAPGNAAFEIAKRELVEVFCPRSEAWRSSVLARGHQLVERAVEGLAG